MPNSTEVKTKEPAQLSVELPSIEKRFEVKNDMIYDLGLDYLRSAILYDHETGVFTWSNDRCQSHYKSSYGYNVFIGKFAGKKAGTKDTNGYVNIQFNHKSYKGHRLAFYLCYGWLPEEVDHKNCIRSDNRISNLRAANSTCNTKNRKINKNNKSGYKGVDYLPRSGRYRAQIQVNKIKIIIGEFNTAKLAHDAYVSHANKLHGEFKNTGQNIF